MPPVNTMPPRTSQVHGGGPGASKIDPNPSSFNLREFVADEDAANFNSTLWKPIDQQSFVTAQREALEAYNIEKALRLSKATAAEESQRRTAAAAAIDATISISSASASGTARVVIAPVSEPQASPTTATGRSSVAQSQPIAIKKAPTSSLPPPPSDEAAAFSLARSWKVDALQVPLLENKQPAVPTTTTSSSSNMSAKPKSSSTSRSSSPPSSYDKKASAPVSLSPKQRSQNISLSTSSSASVPSHSRVSISHSNTILSSPQSHRIEQRPLSKRDPEPTSNSSRPAVNSDVTNTTPKRPRTERQISASPPHSRTTSSHAPVAVPSSPDPKKPTASLKDVRPGLILNPSKENSTPVEPSQPSRSRPADRASESSSDHQFLTATRKCVKCGNLVSSPRSQPSFEHDPFSLPFSDLIHLFCTGCGTCHCRGCFAVARCRKGCSGGSTCTVRNCCPEVRAVAIFEALSSFDSIFASEAGFTVSVYTGSKQHRQAYLKLLISKADKQMRRFEDALVRTLRILCIWLQAPTRTAASRSDDDDEEGGGVELHPSVARLFSASYLPEVIHTFLRNSNMAEWIAHSDTYIAMLDTLRRMSDTRSLSALLAEPLTHVDRSPGLQKLVWDQGAISYVLDEEGMMLQSPPLRDAVKQLEAYRRPLRLLLDKIQFEATVEKVNNLCDGISYLMLQQVVGCL